jgi:two-component system sensor histidine kinase KdpD
VILMRPLLAFGMATAPAPAPAAAWRHAGVAVLLIAAATAASAALDRHISLTSQAMLYLVAVVVAAYACDRLVALGSAVGAVTAFNFFFVPPRYTLAVENREHLIALAAMLGVALLVSWLSARVRSASRLAAESERRAHQLSALAAELLDAKDEAQAAAAGERALRGAFERVVIVTLDAQGAFPPSEGLPLAVEQSLRCAIDEAAVIGPGTGRWPGIDAWVVPLGSHGHVIGAVRIEPATATDETGREHAMALASVIAQGFWRLRSAAAERDAHAALERQQLQSTFLAAVSHDLRTPLAAIVAAASSLQAQGERLAPAERERMLAGIVGQARHLGDITENALELVRLAAGPQALRREWQSVEEIVGSVVGRLRGTPCGARIEAAVEPALPLVRGDATLLAQLLANLLDNACRYAGDGPLRIDAVRRDGAVAVSVSDRGAGLSADDEARLFEPFARGETRRAGEGAGLGLALCKSIAEAHGGRLEFMRRRRGGSRFTLMLPIEPQPAAAGPASSPADGEGGRP